MANNNLGSSIDNMVENAKKKGNVFYYNRDKVKEYDDLLSQLDSNFNADKYRLKNGDWDERRIRAFYRPALANTGLTKEQQNDIIDSYTTRKAFYNKGAYNRYGWSDINNNIPTGHGIFATTGKEPDEENAKRILRANPDAESILYGFDKYGFKNPRLNYNSDDLKNIVHSLNPGKTNGGSQKIIFKTLYRNQLDDEGDNNGKQ